VTGHQQAIRLHYAMLQTPRYCFNIYTSSFVALALWCGDIPANSLCRCSASVM